MKKENIIKIYLAFLITVFSVVFYGCSEIKENLNSIGESFTKQERIKQEQQLREQKLRENSNGRCKILWKFGNIHYLEIEGHQYITTYKNYTSYCSSGYETLIHSESCPCKNILK